MDVKEILELKENFEVELKKATGKDGKGWTSYRFLGDIFCYDK